MNLKLIHLFAGLIMAVNFLYLATRPDAPFVAIVGAVFANCFAAYAYTEWMRERGRKSPDKSAG